MPQLELTKEAADAGMDDFFEKMRFKDLHTHKIDVTSPCTFCKGEGERDGEECPICQGEKTVTQHMPLIKIAKMLTPFIIDQLAKAAAAAEER